MKLLEKIVLMFMRLYFQKSRNAYGELTAELDHRNYGHGFFGSIIWAIAFLAIGHLSGYEDWVVFGVAVATVVALFSGVVWELIQVERIDSYAFNWLDVLAGNIWFVPLWFVSNLIGMVVPSVWNRARSEYLDGG